MKVKFANRIYEVLFTKELAGLTMYAVEDEPNHIDWLINVEVVDAEKKELKKVNKNTDVGHEYFSNLLEKDDCDNIDDYAYQCAYCMSHDWLKDTPTWDDVERACKLGAKWYEEHHKFTWSEEDEANFQCALSYINSNPLLEDVNVENCRTWLKSLKDRVRPKQEWSEQEQIRINRIVGCLENLNVADNDILLKDVDWLKSLKPQNRWKPSNEQIIALRWILNNIPYNKYKEEISGLLEQIKKL